MSALLALSLLPGCGTTLSLIMPRARPSWREGFAGVRMDVGLIGIGPEGLGFIMGPLGLVVPLLAVADLPVSLVADLLLVPLIWIASFDRRDDGIAVPPPPPRLPDRPAHDDHGDDARTATPIEVGAPLAGTLEVGDRLDAFLVELRAGARYEVEVWSDGGVCALWLLPPPGDGPSRSAWDWPGEAADSLAIPSTRDPGPIVPAADGLWRVELLPVEGARSDADYTLVVRER